MTGSKLPDLNDVQNDRRVKLMLEAADKAMEELGYTEHGVRHAMIVSSRAKEIMVEFGFTERQAELTAIAGYLHDVGNLVARTNHALLTTTIVYPVLIDLGFDYDETFQMLGYIASHEDETGVPTNPMDAAIVIADKSDVHRSRVREWDPMTSDIHDRVNLAATSTKLIPDKNEVSITLDIRIDNQISSVMEYLHIFLDRMDMCLSAGQILGAQFQLVINGVKMYKEEISNNTGVAENNVE